MWRATQLGLRLSKHPRTVPKTHGLWGWTPEYPYQCWFVFRHDHTRRSPPLLDTKEDTPIIQGQLGSWPHPQGPVLPLLLALHQPSQSSHMHPPQTTFGVVFIVAVSAFWVKPWLWSQLMGGRRGTWLHPICALIQLTGTQQGAPAPFPTDTSAWIQPPHMLRAQPPPITVSWATWAPWPWAAHHGFPGTESA